MLIAISGTPGTGKHTISSALSDALKYNVVDVNKFIGDKKSTVEISPQELNALLHDNLKENSIIVSHMAHFIKSHKIDLFVVLRCRPDILIKRLYKRGYTKQKIYDNALFEAIDGEYIEACELQKNVLQIDNTKSKKLTIEKIKRAIYGAAISDKVDYSRYIKRIEKMLK